MGKQNRSHEGFSVGSAVRVKPGTPSDYPDIPLGGWAGVIREIDASPPPPPMCLVEFDKETLDQVHPAYRKRCDRDGFSSTQMWLPVDALDPNPGGPVRIEQPTSLASRPFDPHDADDRIREILGLTSDDPIEGQGGHSASQFEEHFRIITEARTQNVLESMFPALAAWVQQRGAIEIGLFEGAVRTRLLDSSRVLFEDARARDLAEALNVLERAIARRLATQRPAE